MLTETLRGKVWKFGDNLSTDLMMPGFVLADRAKMTNEEAAGYCMFANRPDWSRQVESGDVVVGGRNFGCGSSRPAAELLRILGISAVVAESVGRIFYRNAINLGLPVVVCEGVHEAFQEGHVAEVNLTRGEVRNVSTGRVLQGEALPADSPPMEVLRAGGISALLEAEYSAMGE